jgi:hypothetical protein
MRSCDCICVSIVCENRLVAAESVVMRRLGCTRLASGLVVNCDNAVCCGETLERFTGRILAPKLDGGVPPLLVGVVNAEAEEDALIWSAESSSECETEGAIVSIVRRCLSGGLPSRLLFGFAALNLGGGGRVVVILDRLPVVGFVRVSPKGSATDAIDPSSMLTALSSFIRYARLRSARRGSAMVR